MRRIWLSLGGRHPDEIQDGEIVKLVDEAFHHAIVVSRLSLGEKFESLSGHPTLLSFEIVKIEKKSADIKVVGRRTLPTPVGPPVGLAVAICKWDSFDWIIEKCVELGVTSIQPLVSQNSFIKKVDEISEARQVRWQKTVESATTQSMRGSLLRIEPPMSLKDFCQKINQNPGARCLFAYEGATKTTFKQGVRKWLADSPKELWALVGSEGGFSAQEAQDLNSQGFDPVSMGEQILRVETACIALMSVIKYELS